MEHQDWNPVVLGKPKSNVAKKSNPLSDQTHAQAVARKLEDPDENYVQEKVSLELRQKIQKARTAKKWSQDDLAKAIFVKKDVIAKYEAGTVAPDPDTLNKMQRALGVVFRKM
jgi:putative transcription factor